MVSRNNKVFIIGGYCDDSLATRIARFSINSDVDSWKEVVNLQAVRGDHRAIANGDRFYVIGGYNDFRQAL